MKKFLFVLLASLTLTSCHTVYKSATTMNVAGNPITATFADLEVSQQKITYTMYPRLEVRKGGYNNVVETAYSEALEKNGGADVLVSPDIKVTYKRRLFSKKISEITVSGYPAKYTNFRSADESYWKNH